MWPGGTQRYCLIHGVLTEVVVEEAGEIGVAGGSTCDVHAIGVLVIESEPIIIEHVSASGREPWHCLIHGVLVERAWLADQFRGDHRGGEKDA